MWRRIALSFLFILVVAVLAGGAILGYLYWDVTREEPGPPGGQVSADSSPPASDGGRAGSTPSPPEQTLERLEEDFQGSPAPGGAQSGRFDVRITESEANELITSLPEVQKALSQYDMTNLRIRFEPGQLVASGRVPIFADIRARITVRGRIWAEDGNLAYQTESVSAGSFPAPGALRDQLDTQLRNAVQQLNRSFEGRVTDVTVTDEALEIEGTRG